MSNTAALQSLIFELWADLRDVRILWQVGVVAVAVLFAWWGDVLVRRRCDAAGPVRFASVAEMRGLQFPVTALALMLIGRFVLKYWQPVSLLNILVPLLVALITVRVAIYLLRHAFPASIPLNTIARVTGTVVWLGFALYVTGLAPDLLKLLDDLDINVGKQRISLLLILQGLLSVVVTLLIAMWLGRFVESRVMGAQTLDINLRVMLSKLAQALLILAAVLVALPAVGIDLTVLSVFGGMLGVGIGFGLQKIASNYLSGFIILMDRSISIGDLVTIDGHTGQLTRLTSRYVVVRSLVGLEAIIPNDTIITSTVLNHSYSDRSVRIAMPVQVSYRSDLDAAMRIMVTAAQSQDRVLRDPPPGALVVRFADSGVDLELGIWVDDPQEGTAGLRSDIYLEIWREFRKNGVEIPYPQREVRVLGATTGAGAA